MSILGADPPIGLPIDAVRVAYLTTFYIVQPFELVENQYLLDVVFTNMATSDVPNSVRVRCGEGSNEWRYDAIESASSFYDRNRSDAIAFACNDVPGLVGKCRKVLERDDLTAEQREEIAETLNQAVRGVEFVVESSVSIDRE